MKLKISEIFHSIQGEGVNVGKPSIFLRTATCNLQCSWCDTKYTWDWKNYDYNKEVKEMEIPEIKNEIIKFNEKNLVITGGEPLLQQEALIKLFEEIKSFDYFVEVETNGTIKPTQKMLDFVDQWNVSPKTANSNNNLNTCENAEAYTLFKKLDNSIFKFVIDSKEDMVEVENLIKKYDINREKIFLMPQASDKEELYKKRKLVQNLANKYNVNETSRLHIELWGNIRGK